MKAFIITLVACLAWIQPAIAQNDAAQVWAKFKNDTNNMYIFLDGITDSNSPKNFTPYIEQFVDICLKRGVEWNALYDEFKETVLPKDADVAACYAVCLCKHTKDYSKIIEVLSLLPTTHEYNAKDIKHAVIYPNGKIAIAINLEGMKYGNTIGDLVKASSGPNLNSQYESESQTFLYQPTGNSLLGLFKNAGTNDLYNVNSAKISDQPNLCIGFTLNKQGEKISEKYEQYDSFAKMEEDLRKTVEKEAAQTQANFDKKNSDIEKRLVAKYGRKAYDSMANARPYVGMPEGLVRDLCVYCRDGHYRVLYKYAYTLMKTGHKVYKETGGFSLAGVKAPYLIYTINGRVTGWKY